jgi:hypothetical protein
MYLLSVIRSPRGVRTVLCGRQEAREDFIDEELFLLLLIKQIGIRQFKRQEWVFRLRGQHVKKQESIKEKGKYMQSCIT